MPVENLIGVENEGFKVLMTNFNHERFVIAAGTLRSCRRCYQEAIHYAIKRKTFGQRLIDHQVIRWKLAEMARQIEALQDAVEKAAFEMSEGTPQDKMGAQCALLKVQASKTYEYCAREASQIFGGSSLVREGQGKVVEALYRGVRGAAIPGGSEEVMLDYAMRDVLRQAARMEEGQTKSNSKL